jgi:hypothetical protein
MLRLRRQGERLVTEQASVGQYLVPVRHCGLAKADIKTRPARNRDPSDHSDQPQKILDNESDDGAASGTTRQATMSGRPALVAQSTIARAIRAAQQCGAQVVEIAPDGTIRINLVKTASDDSGERPVSSEPKKVIL